MTKPINLLNEKDLNHPEMDTLQRSVIKCQNLFKKRYSLDLPEDWLRQCVEFALDESPNCNIEDVVFQQLCDFDMCEIGSSSLPKIIISNESGTIEGIFLCQISFLVDSTESYFNKIQKLLGKINENALVDADNVPGATQFERRYDKKKSLMTIFITDGSISLKAIEHEHIPILSHDDILPGRKILLKGRIKYQNQVLFLKPENLELLEGHVEGISNSEHLVELLQAELDSKCEAPPSNRELTMKLNKLSVNAKKAKLNKESCPFEKCNKQPKIQQINTYNDDDDDDDDLLQSCDLNEMVSNSANNKCKRIPSLDCLSMQKPSDFGIKKLKKQPTIADSDDEDDLLLQENLIKCETAAFSTKNNVLNSNRNIQNINLFKEPSPPIVKKTANQIQEKIFQDKEKKSHKNYEEIMEVDEVNFETKNPSYIKNVPNQKRDIKPDVLIKQEINYKPEPLVKQEKVSKPVQLNKPKIETLIPFTKKKEFLENCCLLNQPNDSDQSSSLATCKHLVKCTIETLTDRLKQFKLKWYQDCRIKDAQTIVSIDAYIGDIPMNKLLGLTVAQVKEKYLQKQSSDYDRAKALCDKKLEKIRCIMHLKYDFEKQKFCVWDIEGEEFL